MFTFLLKRGNFGHISYFNSGLGLGVVGRHIYCDERPTFQWNFATLKTVLESCNSRHLGNVTHFFCFALMGMQSLCIRRK